MPEETLGVPLFRPAVLPGRDEEERPGERTVDQGEKKAGEDDPQFVRLEPEHLQGGREILRKALRHRFSRLDDTTQGLYDGIRLQERGPTQDGGDCFQYPSPYGLDRSEDDSADPADEADGTLEDGVDSDVVDVVGEGPRGRRRHGERLPVMEKDKKTLRGDDCQQHFLGTRMFLHVIFLLSGIFQ